MQDFSYGLNAAICLLCTSVALSLLFIPKVSETLQYFKTTKPNVAKLQKDILHYNEMRQNMLKQMTQSYTMPQNRIS